MVEVTYFVAAPFVVADDSIAAGEPTECFNPTAVVMRAEALSRKPGHVGAVAFSRTGDPATGDFGDAEVIKKVWRGVRRSQYIVAVKSKLAVEARGRGTQGRA